MSVDLTLLAFCFNQHGYISLSGAVTFGVPCFMARKVRS